MGPDCSRECVRQAGSLPALGSLKSRVCSSLGVRGGRLGLQRQNLLCEHSCRRECSSHRTGGLFFPDVKGEGSWLLVTQGHRDVGGVSSEPRALESDSAQGPRLSVSLR